MALNKTTGEALQKLRTLMGSKIYHHEPLDAYLIPAGDEHNNEYTPPSDQRRSFISGFTGSTGMAVVTKDKAFLWTDEKFHLQASKELDGDNWQLVDGPPSLGKFLSKALPEQSVIGVDPKLCAYTKWASLLNEVEPQHKMVQVETNLIDAIWQNKPKRLRNSIVPLQLQYSGMRSSQKLVGVREDMEKNQCSTLVLTALDEIAWLLNMRGRDVPYNPLFYAYVVIEGNKLTLFAQREQLSEGVLSHLKEELEGETLKLEDYDKICDHLLYSVTIRAGEKIWLSPEASCTLTQLVPERKRFIGVTPVALRKVIKNTVEIEGMKNAHVKDAAALCCYFAWLEMNLNKVTEMEGAYQLEKFRRMQDNYIGPSFPTVSAMGSHGALINYRAEPSTDALINDKGLYLCDSGGQYKDGTTDVSRTMHFGLPTDKEVDLYTRVLKGNIALSKAVFPAKTKGVVLDAFSRKFLWELGLEYPHVTGHGIGAYLNAHEGPIMLSKVPLADDPGLDQGTFVSNEPGCYQPGTFGIRIEDVLLTVFTNTRYNGKQSFLGFEYVSLVPKQAKLVNRGLLSGEEVEALDRYHEVCREVVGPLLERQEQYCGLEWLMRETRPLSANC